MIDAKTIAESMRAQAARQRRWSRHWAKRARQTEAWATYFEGRGEKPS